MEKIANVAKNTSYFTIALIVQKIISFSYFMFLARALGPEDLGKYYFAISLTSIFGIFIDLGSSNVLVREVAKNNERGIKILSNIITIKIFLAALIFLATLISVNILKYPEITKDLVYISALAMILDSFVLTFFAVARGRHNLFYESIASVIFQLIVLCFGLFTLYLGWNLRWQMVALTLASSFCFFYSSFLLFNKWKIKFNLSFDREIIKNIFNITAPFAIFAIAQRFYTYFDSVLLSIISGDKYVGIYQVAFKIIFAIQFLPAAFIASLYPALSAYWTSNREQLMIAFERAMNYLIIISVPITVGIIVLADKIILIFKSGFSEAILPLQIAIAAVPFIFLSYPIGSLLNACDKQKRNMINMIIVVIISIILNLLFIPQWNAIGASLTALISSILMFILGIVIVPQIITYRVKKNLKIFFKTFLGALIMSLIILELKNLINIFLVVLIGSLIYFVTLFILKTFRKEDIISIIKSFR